MRKCVRFYRHLLVVLPVAFLLCSVLSPKWGRRPLSLSLAAHCLSSSPPVTSIISTNVTATCLVTSQWSLLRLFPDSHCLHPPLSTPHCLHASTIHCPLPTTSRPPGSSPPPPPASPSLQALPATAPSAPWPPRAPPAFVPPPPPPPAPTTPNLPLLPHRLPRPRLHLPHRP